MFDLTNRNSFLSVARWKNDLDSKVQLSDGSRVPCLLLANKVRITFDLESFFYIKGFQVLVKDVNLASKSRSGLSTIQDALLYKSQDLLSKAS